MFNYQITFIKNIMDLYSLYTKSLAKYQKHLAIIQSLDGAVRDNVKRYYYNKYHGTTIRRDGLEFELLDVTVSFGTTYYDITEIGMVRIRLDFICKSKLPKAKADRVKKAKQFYNKWTLFPANYSKIPLWHDLDYQLSLDQALCSKPDLKIT